MLPVKIFETKVSLWFYCGCLYKNMSLIQVCQGMRKGFYFSEFTCQNVIICLLFLTINLPVVNYLMCLSITRPSPFVPVMHILFTECSWLEAWKLREANFVITFMLNKIKQVKKGLCTWVTSFIKVNLRAVDFFLLISELWVLFQQNKVLVR